MKMNQGFSRPRLVTDLIPLLGRNRALELRFLNFEIKVRRFFQRRLNELHVLHDFELDLDLEDEHIN
jgi:hypothetical protein